ncbi:GNAT family N-acetyltransferase [Brachybacterium endophyticum]|uniref:GNAT family N-acetyltransferase n=1 Tax=Brachybacterium endophyticum TaxID=2182385 RepID=A0A2U2RI22_9MICO|nr:GNAT family N-acetyltransferase [Brachybacterium endophyticum]PWH05532.1 GNAT family N-acetyltransferase [Brachybacterium endophyticum]
MPARDLTTEDLAAYRRLTAEAFGGVPSEVPAPFSPAQIPIGIDAAVVPGDERTMLAAGACIRRDEIALGGGTASCGGIGGLAVHPAHRGVGLFSELIDAALGRCAAEGMAFSMLYPSNPAIYRRHGYQLIARTHAIVLPLGELQRVARVPGRRTVAVTEHTMPRLRALYEELTAGDNGMLRRRGPLFPEGLPAAPWGAILLQDDEGRDRGYLSFSRISPGSDGAGLEVHEVLGRDREDLLALLHHLGSWSTVTYAARLRLRTEDPVLDLLPGGGLRTPDDIVPLVMMRLVDTARALRARPAPEHCRGTLDLWVEDTTPAAASCRAAGGWRVDVHDGAIEVEQLDPDAAPASLEGSLGRVELDVHAAALLLSGGRSLADARRLGLRAESDPPAERLLDAVLAGPRPSVMDAF